MMAFFALSALLVAGVLLFIVPPLFSKGAGAGLSCTAVRLAVHRDQLCELEADARAGALAAEQHEGAKRELEARLLDDLEHADAAAGTPSRSGAAAVAAGVAIPLFAGLLYLVVGNPQAILPGAVPGDARLLADYAHALALAGSAAFEREDYATALAHWQRLLPLVPPNSSSAMALQARIAEARSLGGE